MPLVTRWHAGLIWAAGALYLFAAGCACEWGRGHAEPQPIDLYLAALLAAGIAYSVLAWLLIARGPMPVRHAQALMAMAAAARAAFLLGPHRYNSDLFRNLWDGRLLLNGLNPYAYVPNDAALAAFRDPILWHGLNPAYNDIHTVYGPAAMLGFLVCAVLPFEPSFNVRLVMTLGDLGAIFLLVMLLRRMRLPESWALLYALAPVTLDSFAQRGQMEGLLLPVMLGAALAVQGRRWRAAGFLAALCALIKLNGLLLGPLLLWCAWRQGRSAVQQCAAVYIATGALGSLPILLAGVEGISGFLAFGSGWRTNASLFPLVEALAGSQAAIAVALAVLAGGFAWAFRTGQGVGGAFPAMAALVMLALLLASPAVFPWYTTWALPFAPFLLTHGRWASAACAAILALGTASLMWYLRFLVYPPLDDPYWAGLAAWLQSMAAGMTEPWRLAEYGIAAFAAVLVALLHRPRVAPFASSR